MGLPAGLWSSIGWAQETHSCGVKTLDHFSTICKVHILFDHLIEHVAFHLLGQALEPYSIVLFNKQTLDRIHDRLRRSDNILDVSLNCDRWIASSLLQKSIRRGDVELAQRAACTLHAFDRSAVCKRRCQATAFSGSDLT